MVEAAEFYGPVPEAGCHGIARQGGTLFRLPGEVRRPHGRGVFLPRACTVPGQRDGGAEPDGFLLAVPG
ncbi:hypothetical protein [Coprobacter secundus]|uniref:hypothetical protein n=1 Tax=Coprobacter secundus TaxID=1501392 RepID=UPI00190C79FB|nr:hypothetical protein [Coprobacter secundus]